MRARRQQDQHCHHVPDGAYGLRWSNSAGHMMLGSPAVIRRHQAIKARAVAAASSSASLAEAWPRTAFAMATESASLTCA